MTTKTLTGLAIAAAFVTALAATPSVRAQMAEELVTNGPQTNRGDLNWDAQRNVRDSERYEQLLRTNPGFRQARMRKECGPIADPQLRADCLGSFGQSEPYFGSSTPPRD